MRNIAFLLLILIFLTSLPSCKETFSGTPDPVDIDNDGIDDSVDDCIDVDGDQFGIGSDCLGPDCNDDLASINTASPEVCDCLDNDCDGEIDEDFPVGTACIAGESPCGTGVIECSGLSNPQTVCSTSFGGSSFNGEYLSCGDSISGTTAGKADNCSDYGYPRQIWPGSEAVYAFQSVSDGIVTVDLTELSEDLDLLLLESDCMGTSCTDYSALARTSSERITLSSTAGEIYYLIVDSRYADVTGTYQISLSCN